MTMKFDSSRSLSRFATTATFSCSMMRTVASADKTFNSWTWVSSVRVEKNICWISQVVCFLDAGDCIDSNFGCRCHGTGIVEFWDEGRQTMNSTQPLQQSITVTVEATEF